MAQVEIYINSKYSNSVMVFYKLLVILVEKLKDKMTKNNNSDNLLLMVTQYKKL